MDNVKTPLVTDKGLRVLAAGCWNLRTLVVKSCVKITDLGLAEIARCCTKLTYVNADNVRPNNLQLMFTSHLLSLLARLFNQN